jgi:isoleucyl-tRNA synthetase
MPTSQDIFSQVTDGYRRLRNTVRFLLANVSDFDPARDAVPYDQLREVDRWALHRLSQLVTRVTEAYEEYEFHRVYHSVHTFCAVDLSAFYLDVLKDTLYTAPPGSPARRSAQTVLFELASTLARLTAPILTHTAEEIWRHLPHPDSREPSIQLADYPQPPAAWKNDALAARWDRFLAIRAEVSKALEEARAEKRIAQPLAAEVTLHATEGDRLLLASLDSDAKAPTGVLASLLIVSQAQLAAPGAPVAGAAYKSAAIAELAIEVKPASGEKCERCWLTLPSVGQSAGHATLCRRCADIVQGD